MPLQWPDPPHLYTAPLPVPILPTPAAEVDHDVCLSVVDTGKPKGGHSTPDLEGTGEGIFHRLGVEIRRVVNDPGGGRSACECTCVLRSEYAHACECVYMGTSTMKLCECKGGVCAQVCKCVHKHVRGA